MSTVATCTEKYEEHQERWCKIVIDPTFEDFPHWIYRKHLNLAVKFSEQITRLPPLVALAHPGPPVESFQTREFSPRAFSFSFW